MDTLAFLCVEEMGQGGSVRYVPKATVFFIQVEDRDWRIGYVVTARHCLEMAVGRPLAVRFNLADGSTRDLPTTREDWYDHDAADIAVARISYDDDYPLAPLTLIPFRQFVGDNYHFAPDPSDIPGPTMMLGGLRTGQIYKATEFPVEVGHDIYFLGLFVQHPGSRKNLPIARFGHISRMPAEPITLELAEGYRQTFKECYLAECHSWGGHSGSPVFWRRPMVQLVQVAPPPASEHKDPIFVPHEAELTALLGLVSAHFDIPQVGKPTGDVGSITTDVNAGIAVVTPAHHIKELLLREDVVKDRHKLIDELENSTPAAKADMAADEQPTPEFDRFNDLTKKIVQVPKSEVEETRKGVHE